MIRRIPSGRSTVGMVLLLGQRSDGSSLPVVVELQVAVVVADMEVAALRMATAVVVAVIMVVTTAASPSLNGRL